jgi:hypothetical protein
MGIARRRRSGTPGDGGGRRRIIGRRGMSEVGEGASRLLQDEKESRGDWDLSK